MGDLYFIEQPSRIVFVYSPHETNTWRLSRLAACQNKKLVWEICFHEETQTWVLQDKSPSSKKEIMGKPAPSENSAQDPQRPPLGMWYVGGYRFEVTDSMPWQAPLDPLPHIEAPFATVQYSENGNIGRLETKMNSTAITDEALEDLLSRISELVYNLGRRPTMVLTLYSDAQDAAVPSIKQVRRFLDWIQENGPQLFLIGRGSAIILRPTGILGYTLVGLIKMVQRMLPPPWPEAIVASAAEAEAFLEEHSRQYKAAAEVVAPLPTMSSGNPTGVKEPPRQWEESPSVPEEPRLKHPVAMEGHGPREWHSPLVQVPLKEQPYGGGTPPPKGRPMSVKQSL